MAASFWISTGDIGRKYETVNIVTAKVTLPTPAFGEAKYDQAFRSAIDQLAQAAVKLGANGVAGIQFYPLLGTFGFLVFATGTAVRAEP